MATPTPIKGLCGSRSTIHGLKLRGRFEGVRRTEATNERCKAAGGFDDGVMAAVTVQDNGERIAALEPPNAIRRVSDAIRRVSD